LLLTDPQKESGQHDQITCPGCGVNAWAKPKISLVCGDCKEEMDAEEQDEGEGSED
jgi:hypothetical protein